MERRAATTATKGTGASQTLKRRGLIAGAAALVAGIAAQRAARPVAAAGNLVLESTANTEATGTGLTYTGGVTHLGAALSVTDGSFATEGSAAVAGLAPAGKLDFGVYGSGGTSGVRGISSGTGSGVSGISGSGIGVNGSSGGGLGVLGYSGSEHGVYGTTIAAQNSGKAGVLGEGSGPGTYGVYGNGYPVSGVSGIGVAGAAAGTNSAALLGTGSSGAPGVKGTSDGIGVYGTSTASYGILGVSSAGAPYSGVTGSVFTATGAAFAGGAQQASAYAAYFTGKVNIDGPFLVNGTQRFTLKHADGTSRLVAGALAVEPMVEDFGKGQLANGAATVTLDADFRDVADTSDYHIFLTPGDGVGALRYARQTATGFAVEEIGGASGGAFRYRIAAKPKDGGGKVQRLAKYEPPNIKIPGINGEPMPPEVIAPTPPTPEKPKEPATPPPAPPAPAPPPRTAPTATTAPSAPVSANVQPTLTTPAPQPAPPPRP